MLDFNNTEIAFSSKSRGELQNAYWLFNTIKYPWLVKCAKVATSIALKIHFPLAWAVKPTLYKQFVGGETLQDCSAAINHLMKYNVKSTLDYSAESEQTPEGIQATFEETLRSIDFAKGNTNLAYAVFKPSTIDQALYLVAGALHDGMRADGYAKVAPSGRIAEVRYRDRGDVRGITSLSAINYFLSSR